MCGAQDGHQFHPPLTKNDLALNANSAKVEKSRIKSNQMYSLSITPLSH